MVLEWVTLRDLVIKRLSKKVYDQLVSFIQHQNLHLWGEQRPHNFEERITATTLYKYLTNTGFNTLASDTKSWLYQSNVSLPHNAERIILSLQEWGEQQIKLGNSIEWELAARSVPRSGSLKNVNLWMDSTDFPKQKKRGKGPASKHWSFKLNRPGRRFMVLRDGRRRVRKLWGGYRPKIHDAVFLEVERRALQKELKGAVVVADTHFSVGKKLFSDPKFITPPTPVDESDPSAAQISDKTLTKKERRDNTAIHALRARVEQPFGLIKTWWECLKNPWSGSDNLLDAVVVLAFGCYNAKLT